MANSSFDCQIQMLLLELRAHFSYGAYSHIRGNRNHRHCVFHLILFSNSRCRLHNWKLITTRSQKVSVIPALAKGKKSKYPIRIACKTHSKSKEDDTNLSPIKQPNTCSANPKKIQIAWNKSDHFISKEAWWLLSPTIPNQLIKIVMWHPLCCVRSVCYVYAEKNANQQQ